MCLAIHKPASLSIPAQSLSNGFSSNSHGAGFAVVTDDNRVLICKGFFTFDAFHKAYLKYSENQRLQAVIHFRWATHGKQNAFNCHPWSIGAVTGVKLTDVPLAEIADAAMVHNGILSHRSDDGRSDTGYYVYDILDPLYSRYPAFIGDDVMEYLIGNNIGSYNKFALIAGDGSHSVINAKQGKVHEGVWYSNEDFRSTRSRWYGVEDGDDTWDRRGAWNEGTYKSLAAQAALGGVDEGDDTVEIEDDSDPSLDLAIFPGQTLLAHEQEQLNHLVELFPEVVSRFEDPDQVFAFFRGARTAYRRTNPEAAKLSTAEVDQMMHTESYVEGLVMAGIKF